MRSDKDVRTEPSFDIVRSSHVEFAVRDLEKSRDFYVSSLGFIETQSTESQIYLRGLEDRFSHSLILTKSKETEHLVNHLAFRVRRTSDLEPLARLFQDAGSSQVKWLESGEDELGRGPAFRAQDPFGFPVEFFSDMDEAEWNLQRFDRYHGARPMRIDHFNVLSPNVKVVSDWYVDRLGFLCSEFTETDAAPSKLWATWLRRKPTVHDIAIMTGIGPRLHHVGFTVADKESVLDAADILAAKGYLENIERGPGRHGISNAFFMYLRDPDGHRIELYTGDYLTTDPEWKPIKWKLSDVQRQTYWGAPAPESWFKEASLVQAYSSGEPMPITEP